MAEEHVVFIARGTGPRAIRNHGLQIGDVRYELVVNSARATGNPSSVAPACTILVGFTAGHVEVCGTRRVCAAERMPRREIVFHSRRRTFPKLPEYVRCNEEGET
jgi:hypothetical protein